MNRRQADKYTVALPKGQFWEYRCQACGQLRLSLMVQQPKRCGHCASVKLVVGRPGELAAHG